jgi:GNAT superfamily N-acetyltransferase
LAAPLPHALLQVAADIAPPTPRPRLPIPPPRHQLRYEAAHARQAAAAPGGEYYYLSFIGTAPAARGRGHASRLIREVTVRADAEGRPCLLEATSELSAALYARHGFETYDTYSVAPGAPPVFFMRREPRPAATAPAAPATPVATKAPATAPPSPDTLVGTGGGLLVLKGAEPFSLGPSGLGSKMLPRALSEAGSDDSGALIPTAIVVLGTEGGRRPCVAA